jgi:acyl carrier protein phosphodiesterase
MNFLAHLYLSPSDPKVLVGNFMADFVKGRQKLSSLEPALAAGVLLHRTIDEFTDTHAVVAKSKNRLRPVYRHYSAVIVDVFYDHFLARHFTRFHSTSLEQFAAACYDIIQAHHHLLPPALQHMFGYMVRGNWLLNYAKIEGINRTLTGMSRRTPYESKMDEATNDLIRHYNDFETEFFEFFPLLQEHISVYRQENFLI